MSEAAAKIEECRRVLAECESLHGPRHVKTGSAALSLAIHRQHDMPEGFAEAESLAVRAVGIFEGARGAFRPCLAGALGILASIRSQQGDLVETESLLRRSIEFNQEFGEDPLFSEDKLQTLGYLLLKQGRYLEAAEFLERALHVAERDNPADDHSLETQLHPLARAYLGMKRYDDALELLRRELAFSVRYHARDSEERARLLEQVAGALNASGQTGLADDSLREAHQCRIQLDAKRTAKYAHLPNYDTQCEVMGNLITQADALATRWDFRGAMALLQQVLEYRTSHPELHRDAHADLLKKLANCHSNLGQLDEAEALLQESRVYLESQAMPLDELRQKLSDQRSAPTWLPNSLIKPIGMCFSEWLASVLNQLGSLYDKQKRPQAAIESYQRAITIWKVTHEKVCGFVSTGLLNVGSLLCHEGDLERGCDFIEEGLAWERDLQADSSFVATIAANLAHFRQQQGQLEQAVSLWRSAAEIWTRNEGACQPPVLQALNAAGQTLTTLRQWGPARICFLQALGVAREASWCTSQPIVGLMLNLSAVELRQEHFAQAVPYLREALPLCESDPEGLSDEHAVVLRDLTESLVITDQFEEAESVGLRWLAKLKRRATPDDPALPVALANLAKTYHALRRGAQALPLIEQAIPLVAHLAGSDKRALANYYRIQAEILQGLNRFAAAKAANAKAKQFDK